MRYRIGAIVALVGIIGMAVLGRMTTHMVGPGHVGVVTKWGAVQPETLQEGLHLITPVKTRVHDIDVRVQKAQAEAKASSRDLQIVTSKIALNYFVDKEAANEVFQNLGPDFATTIIAPSVQESVKSATALFTAEQLITRRPEVKQAILVDLSARLGANSLIVTDFSIVDFNFSPAFNRAIEEKQVAEQLALQAGNDLQRIRIEAQQDEVRAEGVAKARLIEAAAEAEAHRFLQQDLSDEVLRLLATEKWDGVLPRVVGGADGMVMEISVAN